MIILNFKNYKNVLGKKCIKICKIIEEVYEKSNVEIVVAPQFLDIPLIKHFSFPVISQHVDDVEEGRFTGAISFEALKEHGIKGSLLNHSEKKVPIDKIENIIKKAKKYDIKIFALASNLQEAEKISKFNPYSIGYEPPELIATGKSVSKFRTSDLKTFFEKMKNRKIVKICGAGISNKEDVEITIKLGLDGILISSAFVFSRNKKGFLEEIINVFQKFDRKFPKL